MKNEVKRLAHARQAYEYDSYYGLVGVWAKDETDKRKKGILKISTKGHSPCPGRHTSTMHPYHAQSKGPRSYSQCMLVHGSERE